METNTIETLQTWLSTANGRSTRVRVTKSGFVVHLREWVPCLGKKVTMARGESSDLDDAFQEAFSMLP